MDGKELCIQEANRQNCPVSIALATIEAETNFTNKIGDSGRALGYGQVWPKWHMDAFQQVGKMFGIEVPTDLPSLTGLVLQNDQYSMAVAVLVIKRMWEGVGGDWAQFTYRYVGPKIPASDFERRQKIWNKYNNSNFDYTGTAFLNIRSGYEIKQTNYGVLVGSQKTGDVLYGRRYRILVVDRSGKTALDVSQLHCTFKCIKTILMEPQFSECVIYNLSPETEHALIYEGSRIIIEAGYEGSQYGQIFDGNVVQVVRDKPDGATYTLNLVSADSDMWLNYSLSAFSMVKGQNTRKVIENITNKASLPTELGNISTNLSTSKLTRGKVVFGLSRDYLRQLAQSENATFYMENGKVNIIKLSDLPENEIIDLSPSTGLIGVPAQTDYAVTIKSLLNPRIKLNSLIHVDNSLIRNQLYQQGQPIYPLDNDGIYRVIKVTYNGDTRGNDWYTEVEAISQAGVLPEIVANGDQSAM